MTSAGLALRAAPAPARRGDAPRVVCHVITSLATAGAQKMLLKLVTRLDRERFRSAVVTLVDGPVGAELRAAGVPVLALSPSRRLPPPSALLALRRWLRAQPPALVHGWLYHGNLVGSVCAALGARRVPVIWSMHTTFAAQETERWRTRLLMRLGAVCSSRAERIVYVSRASQRDHEAAAYRPSRGRVIPIGIDCALFKPAPEARARVREELGLAPDALLAGCVARYHPVKNHRAVLEAAATVARTVPGLHLALVGQGVDPSNGELRAFVERLQLDDRVHLLGERTDVPRLTAALDLAVLASVAESWPNVVGEAMASGVPCVVSDVGDTAWIVGDTGRVVPARDTAALAEAILAMVRLMPDARERLGAAARARVATHFSLERVTELYCELYADVLDRRRV